MITDKTYFMCGFNQNTDDTPKMFSTTSSVIVIVMTTSWPLSTYRMQTQSIEKGRSEKNVGEVPKWLLQGPKSEKIVVLVAQSLLKGPKSEKIDVLVAQSLLYGPKTDKLTFW